MAAQLSNESCTAIDWKACDSVATLNILRPEHDNIFKENSSKNLFFILIQITGKFVPWGPFDNKPKPV